MYIREQNYGSLSAALQLDVSTESLRDALETLPADCPTIRLVSDNPELALRNNPAKTGCCCFPETNSGWIPSPCRRAATTGAAAAGAPPRRRLCPYRIPAPHGNGRQPTEPRPEIPHPQRKAD
ncbi:MAG: hypothetical protein H6559_10335 [Lewinellaceae bacterium]|nr:hypothetical protein [Lewinellaceae bacterium]